MSGVISAIVVLLIIGAVAALILVIASKYMSVPENEMFPAIRECLPGANCGACGYAGCDGYAKADVYKRPPWGSAACTWCSRRISRFQDISKRSRCSR